MSTVAKNNDYSRNMSSHNADGITIWLCEQGQCPPRLVLSTIESLACAHTQNGPGLNFVNRDDRFPSLQSKQSSYKHWKMFNLKAKMLFDLLVDFYCDEHTREKLSSKMTSVNGHFCGSQEREYTYQQMDLSLEDKTANGHPQERQNR